MEEILSPESWGTVGIVGVLSLLLVRECLRFLEAQKTNSNGTKAAWLMDSTKTITQLETEIRKLNHAINNLTQVLTNLTHEVRSTRAEVKECRKDIEELQRRST
jgi:peptidoglycan hydrolase CwlO-like protein